MSVPNLHTAKELLFDLEERYFPECKETVQQADKLLDLLNRFPDLEKDSKAMESVRRLVEGFYAMKGALSKDKQEKVTQLFQKVNQCQATRLEHLLSNEKPAKTLQEQHKELQAVLRGGQEYPVPLRLLANEEMPCKAYFHSLSIMLGDGSETKISLGLLAHFSDMVKTLVQRGEMQPAKSLLLEQVTRHQFDALVAFLETEHKALITDENVLPLLKAASFLQIPSLLAACKEHVLARMDDRKLVELLNVLQTKEDLALIGDLEFKISTLVQTAFEQESLPADFVTTLAYYKEKLSRQVSLYLKGPKITDQRLKQLKGLPMRELKLLRAEGLTKSCFRVLAEMPTLKSLLLNHTKSWLTDEALEELPATIDTLEVTGAALTEKGLIALGKSQVRSLKLADCRTLTDDHLAHLPLQLETVDLWLSQIGEKAMSRLGQMTKLRTLRLASNNLLGAHLAKLPKELQTLHLTGGTLSEEECKQLAKMGALQELSLTNCTLPDSGLQHLPPSLSCLIINRCNTISDEGIQRLNGKNALKTLIVNECPTLTTDAFAELSIQQIEVDGRIL